MRPWKKHWPREARSGKKSYQVGYYDHQRKERTKTFASAALGREWMRDYCTAERRGEDSLRRFLLDLDAKEVNAQIDGRTLGEIVELYFALDADPALEGGLAKATFAPGSTLPTRILGISGDLSRHGRRHHPQVEPKPEMPPIAFGPASPFRCGSVASVRVFGIAGGHLVWLRLHPDFDCWIMSTKSHEQRTALASDSAAPGSSVLALDETRSPVVWLVLALVIEQPSHGYEIGQRFEERFGWFLSLSSSSLYAALDRLRGAGMIEEIALEPAERPRRQHRLRRPCRATAAGVRAYRHWVAERMRDDEQRAQILARVASARVLGVDALLDVVDRYEMECMAEMKALPPADIERLLTGEDCDDEELAESLAIDQQRREIRARLDWASHARRVLQLRAERVAAERRTRSS